MKKHMMAPNLEDRLQNGYVSTFFYKELTILHKDLGMQNGSQDVIRGTNARTSLKKILKSRN